MIAQISEALTLASIAHECYHGCIHVNLPHDFDILEVKAWPDGDHSVQLLQADFHTHVDLLAKEYEQQPVEAVVTLMRKIFDSDLLLIEERSSDGEVRKTVEDSLEQYLKYLPSSSTYRIVNQT